MASKKRRAAARARAAPRGDAGAADAAADALGIKLDPPYLHGAYLALNAIPDAYFLGDGPDCLRAKGEHIHGRHDLASNLMSCRGDHRIQYTGVNVFNIASNVEGELAASLRTIASWPGCGAVFLGSMPMCTIAGTDYERILREAFAGSPKPGFLVPPRSGLGGDWLDGYAAVLESAAAGIDLGGAAPEEGAVTLVGNLMLRNEGDGRGDVRELERVVGGLGLDPVSTWLSGRPFAHLREARRAKAVVSLPYGRKAARILAERLGAKLVEAPLPFGLAASKRFALLLGRELGREKEAEAFVRAELDEAAPRLEWVVPHAFLGRRFIFAGAPPHAAGFAELAEEAGGQVTGLILQGVPGQLPEGERAALAARPRARFQPTEAQLGRDYPDLGPSDADLVIAPTWIIELMRPQTAWLEFGYPCEFTHFLREEPCLGFAGAVSFMGRVANAVAQGFCRAALR